jgi:hypothetical protein
MGCSVKNFYSSEPESISTTTRSEYACEDAESAGSALISMSAVSYPAWCLSGQASHPRIGVVVAGEPHFESRYLFVSNCF